MEQSKIDNHQEKEILNESKNDVQTVAEYI
jgi:hypothetical protein